MLEQFLTNVTQFISFPFIVIKGILLAILGLHPVFLTGIVCIIESVLYIGCCYLISLIGHPKDDQTTSLPTKIRICRIILQILLLVLHCAFYKTVWYDQFQSKLSMFENRDFGSWVGHLVAIGVANGYGIGIASMGWKFLFSKPKSAPLPES